MLWRWDQVLKTHPNGMRFSCFGEDGDLLATNEYFSVGGGFVVNDKTKGNLLIFFSECQTGVEYYSYLVDENLFYKGLDKTKVHGARLHQTHLAPDSADELVEGASPGDDIETAMDKQHPPYPFDSGNSLLALTKKHNVGFTVPSHAITLYPMPSQMTIAQIVHDNEVRLFIFPSGLCSWTTQSEILWIH